MIFKNEDFLLIGLGIGMLVLTVLVIILLINKKCSPVSSTYSSCIGCSSNDGLKKWINTIKKSNGGKSVNSCPKKNGYNTFCKNPTNDNWIKALSVGGKYIEGDPYTNGFYNFCGRNMTFCPTGGTCSTCPTGGTSPTCPTGGTSPTCPTGGTCPACPTGGTCPACPTGTTTCPNCRPCTSPNDFLNAGGNIAGFNNTCCKSKANWNTLTGNKQSDLNANGYDLYCVPTQVPDAPRNSTIKCPTCAYSNDNWVNINKLTDINPVTNKYNDFCMTSDGSPEAWTNIMKNANYNRFCGIGN
jgi:hypothetical protein